MLLMPFICQAPGGPCYHRGLQGSLQLADISHTFRVSPQDVLQLVTITHSLFSTLTHSLQSGRGAQRQSSCSQPDTKVMALCTQASCESSSPSHPAPSPSRTFKSQQKQKQTVSAPLVSALEKHLEAWSERRDFCFSNLIPIAAAAAKTFRFWKKFRKCCFLEEVVFIGKLHLAQ